MGLGFIPGLDGLRALSILIVVLSHSGLSQRIPGGFGVTVFFFLSGYLITCLLLREQTRDGTISLRNFYARRVLRLAPPLMACLATAGALWGLGLVAGGIEPWTLLSQIAFFFNYFLLYGQAKTIEGLGVLWSLSVEEHFYLIWPAVFLALMAGRIGLKTLIGTLVAVLVWRHIRVLGFGHDDWQIYLSSDTRMDGLLYGCLLALVQPLMAGGAPSLPPILAQSAPRWLIRVLGRPAFGQGAMLGLVGLCLLVLLVSFTWRDPLFRATWRYSLQGLALMPLFHFAITRPQHWLFRPLNGRVLRKIGLWSYAIYLIHFVIIHALQQQGLAPENPLLLAGLVLLLSSLWAAAVYEWAEKPFHGLRKRLSAPAARARDIDASPA